MLSGFVTAATAELLYNFYLTTSTQDLRKHSFEMREIVTLQFGQQANHVGTHFWNTQVQ